MNSSAPAVFAADFDLLIGGVQLAVADVLADGAGEQVRSLQHDADAGLDVVHGQVGVIHPADADGAVLGFVEAAQQVDDGGLAAAGWSNQRDHLTRFHVQREIAEDGLILLVVEIHMIEFDLGEDRIRRLGDWLVLHIRDGVDEREDAFRRGDGVLHFGIHPRHILDRPHHKGDVGNEGLDAADGDPSQRGLIAAVPDDGTQRDAADDLHHRQKEGRQPGCPVG